METITYNTIWELTYKEITANEELLGKNNKQIWQVTGEKQETEPFSFDHLTVIILVFYITNIINHEKSFPISFKSNCSSEALVKTTQKIVEFYR